MHDLGRRQFALTTAAALAGLAPSAVQQHGVFIGNYAHICKQAMQSAS